MTLITKKQTLALSLSAVFCFLPGLNAYAAPAKTTKKAAPAKKAAASTGTPVAASAPAPVAKATSSAKPSKDGEIDVSITGTRKDKLTIGKIDPPAAFNLEDIQNFPEDRLHPVLNNPITFDEGRDFSSMMESQDTRMIYPWLPEIPRAPYLTMKVALEKPAKDWRFSVIDQGGTPVSGLDGKGNPPASFTWAGDDKDRGHVAVDTVYIPQLSTTDKDGYRRTYMGQPSQFAFFMHSEKGRTVIELSSKRLFLEKKSELSKEAPIYLDKVCDYIRAESRVPFAVQAYDNDPSLGRNRQQALVKYMAEKLFIPESQISTLDPMSSDKRGLAMAISFNGTPGGAE